LKAIEKDIERKVSCKVEEAGDEGPLRRSLDFICPYKISYIFLVEGSFTLLTAPAKGIEAFSDT